MNLNVRKGDNVKVLTGKDKGKTGKVLATDPKTGKVLVEGVNIATHHLKARAAGQQSSIKKVEAPLDGSNVQIVCQERARPSSEDRRQKRPYLRQVRREPRRFRQGGQKEESRQNGQGEKARQEKGGRQSGKGRKDRSARGRRRGGNRSDRGDRREEACGEKARGEKARSQEARG